jgi:peptidoglycan/xylan/chitin deacetylase (PgdA/CDA1 family)
MHPALIGFSASAAVGAAVASWAAVHPRSQLFGATVRHTNSAKQLALTFDDGPNPVITPKLLNLLDKYNVKATFFLIGRFVRDCPQLAQEISARGHLIGNHTQTHPSLFWLSPRAIRNELQECQDALQETLGVAAKYFRPPFGLRNPWVVSSARDLGMQTVMWTLLPGDWLEKPPDWLMARMQIIAEHAQRAEQRSYGDVLCLHDGGHRRLGANRDRTITALEHWLPRWRDLGLKFVTIGEAVKTPAH